jgi:hypothetical protein
MPEALSSGEVAKEVQEHLKHASHNDPMSHSRRWIVVAEAILLSIVTITTAYVGYQAALWQTESRNVSTEATNTRASASLALVAATSQRSTDASAFNTWATSYVLRNEPAMQIAARRFRAEYKVAFGAYLATHPLVNPGAPAGPAYMPQYRLSGLTTYKELSKEADVKSLKAAFNAHVADHYVRITVVLAAALFLAAMSRQFGYRGVRYGLDIFALLVLGYGVYLLSLLPMLQVA